MSLLTYLLVWSIFLQVALTFVVLFKMRFVRVRAFKESGIKMSDIAVSPEAWPDYVRKVQNNYINQFEMPVLFYVACALVLIFSVESWLFVILAFVFVISRIVHMLIHTGSNRIKYRFTAFLVGVICVMAQWGYILFIATNAYLISN